MCEWGDNKPWEWGKPVGHSWRTTGDIWDCFDCVEDHGTWQSRGVLQILDLQEGLRVHAGPDHWNDADMMEVGNGGMTVNEDRAHFTMWSMLASPLIAGNDIRSMSKETTAILTNKSVIALNQDPLGVQAYRLSGADGVEYWVKPLADGDWAVMILNRSKTARAITVDWKTIDLKDDVSGTAAAPGVTRFELRDQWNGHSIRNDRRRVKRVRCDEQYSQWEQYAGELLRVADQWELCRLGRSGHRKPKHSGDLDHSRGKTRCQLAQRDFHERE
jgi:alpha-galactosidase